jgi:UDP-N-acetylglucosamine:LPS N-acetylglucosamine transferase
MGRSTAGGTARVLVISGSVGAGHDGAADELITRLGAHGVAAEYRDFLDAVPWFARLVLRDGYSLSVARAPRFFDWLFVHLERSGLVRGVTLALCFVARLRVRRWAAGYPVVVSTYPLASQTLGQLRGAGSLDGVAVTFLTDPAVHRMWVHPAIDHHLTVTEATSRMGRLVYRTPMRPVGGLVSARFTERTGAERRQALRDELGLRSDLPVALMVTGSLGMGDVPDSVREIAGTGAAQVLVLCGRNAELRAQLGEQPGVVALGWRDDVPDLMSIADVLVHNAGGLSVTEALTAGLPTVTYRPIPGHGTANAAILAEAGLAPWPRTPEELAEVLRDHDALRSDPGAVLREEDAAAVVLGLLAEADPADDATRRTA